MNRRMLGTTANQLIRLNPPARRLCNAEELTPIDDFWLALQANRQGLELMNFRTQHIFWLKAEHVHHYDFCDIESTGRKRALLTLRGQVCLEGRKCLDSSEVDQWRPRRF